MIFRMNPHKNMMKVLKAIIGEPKVSNMEISRNLGITSAAVGKIRDKLEKKGIIKGYDVDLHYDSLGISTFVVLHVRVTTVGWKYKGNMGIQDIIASNPNTIAVYRVPGREITHILICGFRNTKELDRFLNVIQSQLSDYLEIVESFVFSHDNIIKNSPDDLFMKIIDEGEDKRMPEPILFGRIMGEKE
jgi:Lrp/AsnC family leucine-responsive transcriptional regulator